MSELNMCSFQQYMDDGLEDRIKDFTEHNHCSNCGNCCTNILPLNKDEIKRIKTYIRKHDIKASQTFMPIQRMAFDMTCPFRDNNKNCCTIYEIRPKICRLFMCNNEEEAKANRKKFADTRTFIDCRHEFF